MYKVLLVEDETVIRQGLRELIVQAAPQFEVTGEASSGVEALDFLRCEVPDVLITDIRMREMDGLTLVSKARDMYPELLMIIISGYGEFEYARRAMEYGVLNYLLKPIERHELALCIQKFSCCWIAGTAFQPFQSRSHLGKQSTPAEMRERLSEM